MAARYDPPKAHNEKVSQWVSKVTRYSTQYDSTSWPAKQVIGPPKVYPKYGDIPGAWASQVKDAHQFIELEFEEALYISKIDIYETYHAGGVKSIFGKGNSGEWEEMYSINRVTNIPSSRIFSPPLKELGCPCREIRINVDCTVCGTWVEIDAVQLHGQVFRPAQPPPLSVLAEDMRTMVNNKHFSDVEFLVEGKTVFCHKAILCARSSYFRAMFREQTKESQTQGPIDLVGASSEGFMSILHYLYTNDIPHGVPCVELPDICRAADLFSIDGLKILAAFKVNKMLNESNVVDTYIAATNALPVLDDIKENCLTYIAGNMSKVVNTPSFELLPQDVMLEIVQAGTSKLKI